MINIVIPMAGAGSRFAKAGYKNPKPFIDVLGKPMIYQMQSLFYSQDLNIITMNKKQLNG